MPRKNTRVSGASRSGATPLVLTLKSLPQQAQSTASQAPWHDRHGRSSRGPLTACGRIGSAARTPVTVPRKLASVSGYRTNGSPQLSGRRNPDGLLSSASNASATSRSLLSDTPARGVASERVESGCDECKNSVPCPSPVQRHALRSGVTAVGPRESRQPPVTTKLAKHTSRRSLARVSSKGTAVLRTPARSRAGDRAVSAAERNPAPTSV